MNPSGRTPKLTEGLALTIAALVERGHAPSAAARSVGVSPRTNRRWLQLGRAHPQGLYGEYRRLIREAEARGESALFAIVRTAADADPKVAMWILERRWPERWGRHTGELRELQRMVARQTAEIEKLTRDTFGSGSPPDGGQN